MAKNGQHFITNSKLIFTCSEHFYLLAKAFKKTLKREHDKWQAMNEEGLLHWESAMWQGSIEGMWCHLALTWQARVLDLGASFHLLVLRFCLLQSLTQNIRPKIKNLTLSWPKIQGPKLKPYTTLVQNTKPKLL